MEDIVFRGTNDQAVTSSLLIAEKFGKEHKHVLDAIRELIKGCAENSADPMFLMNRDGFTLLAMGFTGKKAMQFKLEYIKAFNKMEAIIKEQTKPKSQAEMLLEQCKLMVEQEHRLQKVEQRLDKIDEERVENGKLLLEAEVSENKVPEITMRNKIRRLVNQYAAATNTSQKDIWHDIYNNLYYAYNISINSYKEKKSQSNLDIAEKHGFLGKMFDIVSKMVKNVNNRND